MTPELRGTPLRSNPEVFSLSNAITFKPDYLASARTMTAPEVWGIKVQFTGTVGGVTATALGADAAKLFDNIRFRDADDVLNVSGAGLRVLEQLEFGAKQVDPATVASGATNASYVYTLRIPFAPWRAVRPRDFAIPLQNFLDGGEFTIATAAAVPTGWAAVQSDWKIRLFADVRDGRKVELKSRRRLKEEALTQQEFDYQINGSLRSAVICSKLPNTSYTDLSGFTTLNSRSLKWPAAYQTSLLLDEYRQEATHINTATDEFVLQHAIPVCVPRDGMKIGQMVDLKSLHIDLLAAAPTSGRLITDVVIDRNASQSAAVAGYAGAGALAGAVKTVGTVVGAAGNYPVTAFASQLARRMPIRLKHQ